LDYIKSILLTILKYATLPLAILYGVIIWLRNKMYDSGWSASLRFNLPIINIGNLSVGGTGKTPHTAYIIELLKDQYQIATLSRGYGRRTRGYKVATLESTANEIGDEPKLFKINYPDITVCVCEDRIIAVPQLKQQQPNLQAILLDDAFQHRSIQPSLNILLTEKNRLFVDDYIMPFGLLREYKSGSQRADVIIITKCNDDLSKQEASGIISKIKPLAHQYVFFSTIKYLQPIDIFTKQQHLIQQQHVLLITAIANNSALIQFLKNQNINFHQLTYRDHHHFSKDDIKEIIEVYNAWDVPNKIVLTTSKDATRLIAFEQTLQAAKIPVVELPIKISFLFYEQEKFNNIITQHMEQFYPVPIILENEIYEKEYRENEENEEEPSQQSKPDYSQ
jgi:tetraacyldisaccharide 4'-kinase